jgi:hypothetical protein
MRRKREHQTDTNYQNTDHRGVSFHLAWTDIRQLTPYMPMLARASLMSSVHELIP